MFDKIKFAKILSNINDTYDTMTEFATNSKVNRTYLSQYINQKLDTPPSPKVLLKIASSSHNLTSYEELMQICGYIEEYSLSPIELLSLYQEEDLLKKEEHDAIEKLNLTYDEYKLHFSIAILINDKEDIHTQLNDILKCYNEYSEESKNKIKEAVIIRKTYCEKQRSLTRKRLDALKKEDDEPQYYMCPLYNEILSEEPYWLDNNIKGRIVLDTNIYNINKKNDYFSIEVNENYTNFRNTYGHYIIFQKQNSTKDDDIILTVIENSKPCIRKYKKLSSTLVMLQPIDSIDVLEPLIIDITNTAMSILGTAIGYFGKMETK